jgi:hypothetical protein
VTSSELARQLGVAAQTVRRLIDELPKQAWVTAGRARRARYALRRALRGDLADLPIYAIDATGNGQPMSSLTLVQPDGTLLPLDGTPWPVPIESRDGWWDGLPYPVYEVRPQGYLGRQLAHAEHRNLGVSEDLNGWSGDDILWVLSRCGADVTGNLVLGNEAYTLWLSNKVKGSPPLPERGLAQAYARQAEEAIRAGGRGSSAAGEFPKFTVLRELEGALTPHVLVKFSGAGGSAAEQRWADLLVCEHHGLEYAARLPGVTAARSRVLSHDGRVFIEVERFDRVGPHGRLPLVGLDSLVPAFLGSSSTEWPELVGTLHEMGLTDAASVAAVEDLWWFGRLIANTDMHLGNLSFHVDGTFRLAATYDMLPMAYAPLPGGEVPAREFTPALPLPTQRIAWLTACAAAIQFWATAGTDTRISEPFRSLCRANAAHLQRIADHV